MPGLMEIFSSDRLAGRSFANIFKHAPSVFPLKETINLGPNSAQVAEMPHRQHVQQLQVRADVSFTRSAQPSTCDSSVSGLRLIHFPAVSASSKPSYSSNSDSAFSLDEMVSEFMEGNECAKPSTNDRPLVSHPRFTAEFGVGRSASQNYGLTSQSDSLRLLPSEHYPSMNATRNQECGTPCCYDFPCIHGAPPTPDVQADADGTSHEIARLGSIIESFGCCESPEETTLFDDVISAMKHTRSELATVIGCGLSGQQHAPGAIPGKAMRQAVVKSLRAKGYDAAVCRSQWDYSHGGIPDGSHDYIEVTVPSNQSSSSARPARLVVDLEFRSQFQVARPLLEFERTLQLAPLIFVGCRERLCRLVEMLAEAMRISLRAQGMHVPPWRRVQYLLAKWTASCERIGCLEDCKAETQEGEEEIPSLDTSYFKSSQRRLPGVLQDNGPGASGSSTSATSSSITANGSGSSSSSSTHAAAPTLQEPPLRFAPAAAAAGSAVAAAPAFSPRQLSTRASPQHERMGLIAREMGMLLQMQQAQAEREGGVFAPATPQQQQQSSQRQQQQWMKRNLHQQ